MSDEPFGRQPQTVQVKLLGEQEDIEYWLSQLKGRAEFKGDVAQVVARGPGVVTFKIFPRAVND